MDTRKRRKEGGSTQSLVFESLQSLPKRAKVHAQRKFAQGAQPNSPAITPVKEFRELRDRTIPAECRTKSGLASNTVITTHQPLATTPSLTSAPARPKTEDFLTFLCFRRTALLPPELEFFETPQLLENSVDVHRITPPQDDKNTKSFKKKDDFSYENNEKKEIALFPESYKRNLEQMENENQGQLSSARVTRSSASLTPTPSFLSSPPSSDYSPQDSSPKRKLTRKQMLLKKAMIIKSKSLNARRRVQVHFRSKGEKRNIITRGSTKEIVSSPLSVATRNKGGKTGKVLFLKRKKEQISRVLKRLGAPVILSPSEKGRVTRSRADPNEEPEEDNARVGKRKSTDSVESLPSKEGKAVKQEENVDEKSIEKKQDDVVEEIPVERSSRVLSPKQRLKVLKNLSCKEVLRKRKMKPADRRVTRRLVYSNVKKEEISDLEVPPVDNTLKSRCTRSASDSVSTEVKRVSEAIPPEPEELKSLNEQILKSSKRIVKPKISELTVNQDMQDSEFPSNVRSRPSRKTKQIAEAYLELISQRLAKESHKGKESDEDIEEDNISISSIKEMKEFSKGSKTKEISMEKCLEEIAVKHEKEIKDTAFDAKEKMAGKVTTTKRVLKEKMHQGIKPKIHSEESSKMDLRSSNIIFLEETTSSGSINKKKWGGTNISPTRKQNSSKVSSPDHLDPVNRVSRSESRSPRLTRISQGRSKSPKCLTPVRNEKSFSSFISSQSPEKSSKSSHLLEDETSHEKSSKSSQSLSGRLSYDKSSKSSLSPSGRLSHDKSSKSSQSPPGRSLIDKSTKSSQSPSGRSSQDKSSKSPQSSSGRSSHDKSPKSPQSPSGRSSHDKSSKSSLSPSGRSSHDKSSKSQTPQLPSNRSPQLQRKSTCQASPKHSPHKCLETEMEISPKGLRRRASEEVKTKKTEFVRRLSYDSKSKKPEGEIGKFIETTSPNLRRRENVIKASKDSNAVKKSKDLDIQNKKTTGKIMLSDKTSTKESLQMNSLSIVKKEIKVDKKTLECISKTDKYSIENFSDNEISKEMGNVSESRLIIKSEPSVEKEFSESVVDVNKGLSRFPKRIAKPKCLPLSPRSKRTASLDSGRIASLKCVQLKRKFGSMESVISNCDGSECEASSEMVEANTSVQNIFSSQSKSNTLKEMKLKIAETSTHCRKPIFSRRRSSIHDEAKLNAVLESVAKDFEKDMDDQLFDKIEKDLNAGNKSPDKANRSFVESLKSKSGLLVEKESGTLNFDQSRSSPIAQTSSSSSSPVTSRKSNSSKKLSDVVRNLQERKQAESPHSFTDSETPPFLQDLKSLDSRNVEKSKQVSEEAIVTQPFDLAPAPSISHPADVADINSLVTLNSSTHPCTSDYKALEGSPTKIIECNIDEKEITSTNINSSLIEKEPSLPLAVTPSASQAESKHSALLSLSTSNNNSNNNNNNNNSNNNNPNIDLTSYIPFPAVNAEPVLNMPITNMNIAKVALNARSVSSIRPPSNINLTTSQLPPNLIPSRITHLGHVALTAAPVPPQAAVLPELPKTSKIEQSKNNSKQILIAPKPSRTSSPIINSNQSLANLKNLPKPIQIAPKLPVNTAGTPVTVGHLHSSTPIHPVSQMGHVIQGVSHQVQTMQALPTVQALPQGVQSLQAITQNYPTIASMSAAVHGVMTQTMAINHNQLMTPSSPAKILTQPVFVTSSMPNMVGTPFDITMQNHLHGNVGTVARVVAQNVVGKVAPKSQSPLVTSGTQSLVTIAPGGIETNVIPSIVPFHQSLQPGHPTQFVAVNMMPVAPSQISLQGPRHITSNQMGPILCPQTMTCIASSTGVPSVSTSLNLIPHGSLVTCPIPDVNTGMCNASLLQPLQCLPISTQATQSMNSIQSTSLENSSPITVNSSSAEIYSEVQNNILNVEMQENEINIPESEDFEDYEETNSNDDNNELSGSACSEGSDSEMNKLEVDCSASDTVLSPEVDCSASCTVLSPSEELSGTSDYSNYSNVNKINNKLKAEKICPEKKSSLLPKYSMGTSPVVSHALSKLFPVAEPPMSLTASDDGSKPLLHSSQPILNKSCSQSGDVSVKSLPSHIFSNFVYTTTSVVIPKMSDQSMTSPKAVTKVSQSSPPYVLSTSTSNDGLLKTTKVVSKTSDLNHLKESPPIPLIKPLSQELRINKSDTEVSTSIQNQNSLMNNKSLAKQCDNLSISQSTAKLLGSIASSSITISVTQKVDSSTIDKSSITSTSKLDPKIFYSKKLNKGKDLVPLTTENLLRGNFSNSITTTTSSVSCKTSSENKLQRNLNSTLNETSVTKQKSKEGNKIVSRNKSQNQSAKINNKQTTLGDTKRLFNKTKDIDNKVERKREPLFKKTLFKNKNSVDEKPSDAFSPLNESSVYAFEPETETPLEMTSPFGQRIKNIQPTPSLPSVSKTSKFSHITVGRGPKLLPPKAKNTVININQLDSSKITKPIKSNPNINIMPTATTAINSAANFTTTTITTTSISSLHTTNSTFKNVSPAPASKSMTNSIATPSAIKSTNSVLPSISNKVPTCTLPINSKPLNIDLSISSLKSPLLKGSENFVSSFDSPNTKENMNLKLSNRERELEGNCNSKLSIKSKEKDCRIAEQNSSKVKLIERERKIDKLLPHLCHPPSIITEDNIPQVDLKDLESESNDSEDLDIAEVNISETQTKLINSTSIAIQCDLDDSQSEKSQDELKGNENGTQTDGPSKFPLPPSASPFYYLPLAMATLGEKLPAQLVQQMLAKTQGLVGAAEAGMILQQAAQLAQQYHKGSGEDEMPSLPPSSSVKPISPKSGSIALQKALKANLASIAQAEISVAQSSGLPINQSTAQSLLMFHSDNKETKTSSNENSKSLPKVSSSPPDPIKSSAKIIPLNKTHKLSEKTENLPSSPKENEKSEKLETKPEIDDIITKPTIKSIPLAKPKAKQPKVHEVIKRRSGRSTTLAATKATESDLQEVEEMRRNRRAKRAAAILAKEESWSSSSEAPLSPIMSPDMLRGWPPPRLTSPTPSQSSEGTNASSSTVSQRSRMSGPHSRRHSPASSAESSRKHGRYSGSSNTFSTDPVLEPGPLRISDNPKLARAPSFFPSEEEFSDPLDYIEKIRPEAEQFGLCRIVPPSNFRPECRVNDDMRFTAYKQYIHRMMRRWGPNDRTLCAIKKCLAKQNIDLTSNPLIGGIELDLVQLHSVVEKHGGLMKVIEKELWGKVADSLKIPKSTQDRLAKLDSIYCKYLLPYSTLSKEERETLLAEVDENHARNSDASSKKSSESSDDEDDDDEPLECIVKGKSTALSAFYRIARNIAGQWQPDPAGLELDERYWEVVRESENYICVHTASIDTSEHGYGFPSLKTSPNAKHPWNLKNLCQNTNSVLRSMGNVIGVTAPTLHVGMMFSTVCWYKDPHSLPWIEYLHTGACKIWYGVSSNNEENFRSALLKLIPDFIKTSPLWLPSDTTMVPPEDLVEAGVKVCRVVQEPGQFVVVFPGAFTSSVCSGYLISESAFFARSQYFDRAVSTFETLAECCEPSMFSLDRLALAVASDAKATLEALVRSRQVVVLVLEREKKGRQAVLQLGLTASERLSTPDLYRKRKNRYVEEDEENCCEICRQHLYVSLVTNTQEETVYCLQHAILFLTNNKSQLPFCKLMYTFSLPELTSILKQVDERIQTKTVTKKSFSTLNKKGKFQEPDSLSSTSSSNF